MESTTIRATICFETKNPEELKRILDHHMEYLIDFNENKDLISSVHGVESYDVNSKCDKNKLQMIARVLEDVLGENEPSDEDLDNDNDKIAVYEELHNLKEALKNIGLM